jgi:hypothetical protein
LPTTASTSLAGIQSQGDAGRVAVFSGSARGFGGSPADAPRESTIAVPCAAFGFSPPHAPSSAIPMVAMYRTMLAFI